MARKEHFLVSQTKIVRCRLCGTVHFQSCDQVFLLYPLLSGVATSDSVIQALYFHNGMAEIPAPIGS